MGFERIPVIAWFSPVGTWPDLPSSGSGSRNKAAYEPDLAWDASISALPCRIGCIGRWSHFPPQLLFAFFETLNQVYQVGSDPLVPGAFELV